MAKNNRDIEDEMSKFEEEITKLIPQTIQPTGPQRPQHSSHNANTNKPSRINIQINPLSIPSMPNPPPPPTLNYGTVSNVIQNIQPPPPPPLAYMPQPSNPFSFVPHSLQKETPSVVPSTSAQKREAPSGNLNPGAVKLPKTMPTTAAAAAQSVAVASAAQTALEKKRKGKEPWDKKKKAKFVRSAAGEIWEDESLIEWDADDFRLFAGDLGNEVNDESLSRAFQKYPSFQKAKVLRDKRTGKTKGYGFVSFKSSEDFIKAMREMDGKYVGNRPIKLRKSNWKDRNLDAVRKRDAEKKKMGMR